jgi:hypothetical protein
MAEVGAPFNNAVAITTSDATTYDPPLKAIYIGGAGNVTVKTLGGHTVLFTAPPVGTILRVVCRQVRATGTSATVMVGLW